MRFNVLLVFEVLVDVSVAFLFVTFPFFLKSDRSSFGSSLDHEFHWGSIEFAFVLQVSELGVGIFLEIIFLFLFSQHVEDVFGDISLDGVANVGHLT